MKRDHCCSPGPSPLPFPKGRTEPAPPCQMLRTNSYGPNSSLELLYAVKRQTVEWLLGTASPSYPQNINCVAGGAALQAACHTLPFESIPA